MLRSRSTSLTAALVTWSTRTSGKVAAQMQALQIRQQLAIQTIGLKTIKRSQLILQLFKIDQPFHAPTGVRPPGQRLTGRTASRKSSPARAGRTGARARRRYAPMRPRPTRRRNRFEARPGSFVTARGIHAGDS